MLDFNAKQKTKYCVDTWVRDEQIKLAIKAVPGRVQPVEQSRSDSVAVVGFGPSLNDTWEQIKQFKYVISCSGAHKFLRDRGITPTWHVEVDPRAHKVTLIGAPCHDTEYLIASACHPKVFEHLKDYNVKLWHVFDPSEDGMRMLPPGEWAVTGGCDVGMRAMSMAAFLGFRDLHIFGIDGSARDEKHAGAHPLGLKQFDEVEFGGRTWKTTSAMLEAAKMVRHEMDMMPAVKATFYGDGLVQAMMQDYVPDSKAVNTLTNLVGFQRPELISATYRDLNAKLHQENIAYGVGGGRHAGAVQKICKAIESTSVLDYGCGKGYLQKALPFPIWEYDPAIPEKAASPRPADLVVCADVLEHIEPELLGAVLADLKRCVKKVGYFVIHTGPSGKILADGRNSHLIQKPMDWWKAELAKYFKLGKVEAKGVLITAIVGA